MQTFLPYSQYKLAAQALDNKRLNKQILECYQILNVLSGKSIGWRNHPAVLMWKESEYHLYTYVQVMIKEARLRGIKTANNEANISALFQEMQNDWGNKIPVWYIDEDKKMRVVTTHKANLFKKDPIHYAEFESAVSSPYNVPCCEGCKYYWVTHKPS